MEGHDLRSSVNLLYVLPLGTPPPTTQVLPPKLSAAQATVRVTRALLAKLAPQLKSPSSCHILFRARMRHPRMRNPRRRGRKRSVEHLDLEYSRSKDPLKWSTCRCGSKLFAADVVFCSFGCCKFPQGVRERVFSAGMLIVVQNWLALSSRTHEVRRACPKATLHRLESSKEAAGPLLLIRSCCNSHTAFAHHGTPPQHKNEGRCLEGFRPTCQMFWPVGGAFHPKSSDPALHSAQHPQKRGASHRPRRLGEPR